jgi:hypothetical protein
MEAAGIEPSSKNAGNCGNSEQGGADSGALGTRNALLDADLSAVVNAWPTLPEFIKAGIRAMIRAVGDRNNDGQ